MKFTILKRLILGNAAIALLIICLGGYIVYQMARLNRFVREVSSVDGQIITLTERLSDRLFSQVGFEKKYLISKDNDFYKKFLEIMEFMNQDIEKLNTLTSSVEGKKASEEIQEYYNTYVSLFMKEIQSEEIDHIDRKQYNQVEKEKNVDEINARLRKIMRIARKDRDAKIYMSGQVSYRALKITYTAVGLAIFLSILISYYNTRSLSRPILLLEKRAKDIPNGTFKKVTGIASPPEIKALAEAFNTMCDRLAELDEMKRDFVSHVSHNLRTPLTAIREATGMLIEGTYADSPEKQLELLTITREECERLIDSVNRILDFSQMEAKMMPYHLKKAQLIPIIQKSLLRLAPIAQRKRIALEMKSPSDLPRAKMDSVRIGQLLDNLIGNALKFSADGGTVTISACLGNDRGRSLVVSVSDTGCGIQQKDLERIFDKFKRINAGESRDRGTGLGLAISRHIIENHGGKIWAQSKIGEGSTFFFSLPL